MKGATANAELFCGPGTVITGLGKCLSDEGLFDPGQIQFVARATERTRTNSLQGNGKIRQSQLLSPPQNDRMFYRRLQFPYIPRPFVRLQNTHRL